MAYIDRMRNIINGKYTSDYERYSALENAKRELRRIRATMKERILIMIKSNNAYFLTMTFDDGNIGVDESHVLKWLRSQFKWFVANEDHGDETNRRHYHAVVVPKDGVIFKGTWAYGILHMQKIRQGSSYKAVTKYVAKLAWHGMKKTSSSKILYSARKGKVIS